jgi:hypothetical protein
LTYKVIKTSANPIKVALKKEKKFKQRWFCQAALVQLINKQDAELTAA